MVKADIFLKLHPLKIAALILGILLYSGLVKQADPFTFRSVLHSETLISVEGVVASNPVKTSSGRFYSLLLQTESVESRAGRASASGHIKLLVPSETVEALYPGKLYSLARTDVPVEEGARLVCTGYAVVSEESAVREPPVFIAETASFIGWKNVLSRIRALCRLYLKRVLYAWGEAGGLLLALMSGSREYTDASLGESFMTAGLAHILALSGMHLSLFISAASLVSVFAGKKAGALLSVLLMCLFIWFAGATPSLVRAFLCLMLMMLARFLYVPAYKSAALDCLCGAFIIQTAILHTDIYNPGFMLSYTAVAGIIILTPHISPFLHRFLPSFAVTSIAPSVSAWIFTAPLSALLFGQITPAGIIASIIVTPLASVFFIAGCVCVLLCFIMPVLLFPLGTVTQVLYTVLKYAVVFFGYFPPIVFG